MVTTEEGVTTIQTQTDEGTVYICLIGSWDTFWGPEQDNYATTCKKDKAQHFSASQGKLDIDVIDAKKYLPGLTWKKVREP